MFKVLYLVLILVYNGCSGTTGRTERYGMSTNYSRDILLRSAACSRRGNTNTE